MDAKRQTKADFWILFAEQVRVNQRPGEDGEAVGQAVPFEEKQASPACIPQPALNSFGSGTVERICDPANLNRAYERVLANKGAPGADGMTIRQLAGWIRKHKQDLIGSLLDGSYRPHAVRGVQIPKPGGGTRQLGIPTVVDRLVQQAILQVLDPILDPAFSASSYGFHFAECKSHLHRMDEWIRRKLRCLRLKQCKRRKPIADWLRKLGVPEWRAWILALSGKG
jgi:RNA-directed DNA polymerase